MKTTGKKFSIITYGCQMNEADSNNIINFFKSNNFILSKKEEADVLIINTCTVRQHAEDKLTSMLGTLKKWKNGEKKLFVIGCAAQRLGNNLKKKYPYIDEVIGAKSYDHLYEILTQKIPGLDINLHNYYTLNKNSDYQIISKGCNMKCSYCIVPYVRGKEQSLDFNEIIKEIKEKAQKNIMEITLLGQTVNSYKDPSTKNDFVDLIREISKIDEIKIIRFLSPHPIFFNDKFFEEYERNKKISRWIHLPLQSGSNKILKKMNRGYTIEKFSEIVNKLKKIDSNTSITTDVIVGYTLEDENDFQQTLKAVKELRFSNIFCFKYSPRFKDRDQLTISIEELKRRHQIILNEAKKIAKEKMLEKIGKIEDVIIYQKNIGKTHSGYNCCIIDNKYINSKFLKVKIEKVENNTLCGSVYE